jgi:hypothetical protein
VIAFIIPFSVFKKEEKAFNSSNVGKVILDAFFIPYFDDLTLVPS